MALSVAGILRADPQTPNSTNTDATIRPSEVRMTNIQIGENLRDDTPSIKMEINAVPAGKGLLEVDYMENGLTKSGYWCQFGLGCNTNGFTTVFQIWSVRINKPLTPPYRKKFGCATNDVIDLEMTVSTNNILRIIATDRNNNAVMESLGIPLPNLGTNFIGGNENEWGQTGIFTETYSHGSDAEILPQKYVVLKPEKMTQVDWVIRKAEITQDEAGAGKMPYIPLALRSGWVNADQKPFSLFSVGPKEANIVWHDGHHFITEGSGAK